MSTRGLWGFRCNGTEKLFYNASDSYPEGLGADVLNFVKNNSLETIGQFYGSIFPIFVDDDKDVPESIRYFSEALDRFRSRNFVYIEDCSDFILDSLWCEYAYIINLDSECVEFYVGFQQKPQYENRYGFAYKENNRGEKWYPCALAAEIPFKIIRHLPTKEIVEVINPDSDCRIKEFDFTYINTTLNEDEDGNYSQSSISRTVASFDVNKFAAYQITKKYIDTNGGSFDVQDIIDSVSDEFEEWITFWEIVTQKNVWRISTWQEQDIK